jgi:hypothetical protein
LQQLYLHHYHQCLSHPYLLFRQHQQHQHRHQRKLQMNQ